MRSKQRRQGAQAVIEMALVLPIMLTLVFNFLAVMVEVEGQNKLHAALSLAAQATLTAPVGDKVDSCTFANETFWSTVYSWPGYASAPPPPVADCTSPATNTSPAVLATPFSIQDFSCNVIAGGGGASDYFTGVGYPTGTSAANPIQCTATQNWNFKNSILGPFVLWQPTFQASAQAVPPAFRQCAGSNPGSCS